LGLLFELKALQLFDSLVEKNPTSITKSGSRLFASGRRRMMA
jgi:hypothetical protein